MNKQKSEYPIGKKLVALMAALTIGLGVTLTGCQPDEPATPDEGMPPPPGEPVPEPAPIPDPPTEPEGN